MQGLGMRGCLSPWSFASSAHLLLKSGAAQLTERTVAGKRTRPVVRIEASHTLCIYLRIERALFSLPSVVFFFQLIRGHHDQHDEMHMVMGTRTPQLQP